MGWDPFIVHALNVVGGSLLLFILQGISQRIGGVNKSIDELNTKMAVIVERVDGHERRLGRLEEIKHGR